MIVAVMTFCCKVVYQPNVIHREADHVVQTLVFVVLQESIAIAQHALIIEKVLK